MDPYRKNDIEFERLKEAIKRIGYGEVRIVIQAGKPVRIEVGIKQIKLDGPAGEKSEVEIIPL